MSVAVIVIGIAILVAVFLFFMIAAGAANNSTKGFSATIAKDQ
jgi:hypothetical protein